MRTEENILRDLEVLYDRGLNDPEGNPNVSRIRRAEIILKLERDLDIVRKAK